MNKKLTKTERDVLRMISQDNYSREEILSIRKISKRALRYHINALKKKGFLGILPRPEEKGDVPPKTEGFITSAELQNDRKIRLHGEEYHIKILKKSRQYLSKIGSTDKNQDFRIKMFPESIELYSYHEYFGDNPSACDIMSVHDLEKFLRIIESDLKIFLIKPRKYNIKRVNAHYAEINNGIAKEYNDKREKFACVGDDGKIWLLIDRSKGLDEFETVHPQASKIDMDFLQPFMNDLRRNNVFISEILRIMIAQQETNYQTTKLLNGITRLINPVKTPSSETFGEKADYIG